MSACPYFRDGRCQRGCRGFTCDFRQCQQDVGADIKAHNEKVNAAIGAERDKMQRERMVKAVVCELGIVISEKAAQRMLDYVMKPPPVTVVNCTFHNNPGVVLQAGTKSQRKQWLDGSWDDIGAKP